MTPEDVALFSGLSHAYGPADDIPALLDDLAGDDWDMALDELWGSILHQGTIYPATLPAMRHIARIAAEPLPGRAAAMELALGFSRSMAFTSGVLPYLPEGTDPEAFGDEARAVLVEITGVIAPLLADDDPEIRLGAADFLAYARPGE
ncbi:MAG: hypothetical protein LBR21_05530, partial [Propionibacteriaceae bacterium]|nr:hypothetical protein [Propionibacteriaceae bacterium]